MQHNTLHCVRACMADSVCEWSPTTKGCVWTGSLHEITAPHTPACVGNPTCDPGYTGGYWNFNSKWKSASAVSKTSVMMLRFAADVSPQDKARVLDRVRPHADWLRKISATRNGFVPEWWVPTPVGGGAAHVDGTGGVNGAVTSAGWLDWNAHGGVHVQALADFASALPDDHPLARAPCVHHPPVPFIH